MGGRGNQGSGVMGMEGEMRGVGLRGMGVEQVVRRVEQGKWDWGVGGWWNKENGVGAWVEGGTRGVEGWWNEGRMGCGSGVTRGVGLVIESTCWGLNPHANPFSRVSQVQVLHLYYHNIIHKPQ